jgi:hypothetical protein
VGLAPEDEVLFPLEDGRVVVREAATSGLFVYDAASERREPVTNVDLPHAIADANLARRRHDGTVVFNAVARTDLPRWPQSWALFDPATKTVRALAPPRTAPAWHVAVLDDGSLIAAEDARTVVRHGPAPGARAVLWPRKAP